MNCPYCSSPLDGAVDACLHCGRSLYTLTIGHLLANRYEIGALLGRGGMGIVYRAYDRQLEEEAAIKVLRPEIAGAKDMARRFRHEVRLARKVRHPNVCGIHDYGEDGHLRFLAMEFVDGVDLREIVRKRGKLPPDEALAILEQVAQGLGAIHDAGIVHRDLKTPNIMVDQVGHIRLMDFGIAKSIASQGAPSLTGTGMALGTPEYMSPEQAEGGAADARSDLYSLGVVTYELLTGDVPFRGATPLETILRHVRDWPAIEDKGWPPGVVRVVSTLLAKRPTDRYRSAREAAAAMRSARQRPDDGADDGLATRIVTPPPVRSKDEISEPHELTEIVATPPPPKVVRARAVGRRASAAVAAGARGTGRLTGRAVTGVLGTVAGLCRWMIATVAAGARGGRRGGAAILTWTARSTSAAGRSVRRVGSLLGRNAFGLAASVSRALRAHWRAAAGMGVVALAAGALWWIVVSAPRSQPSQDLPVSTPTAVPTASASPTKDALVVETPPSSPTPKPSASPTPASARERPRTVAHPRAVSRRARATPTPPPPEPSTPEPTPEPTTGTLRIIVLPWASIEIDGKAVGTTPLSPVQLAPGPHKVRVLNPGFRPLNRTVTIVPGQTATLRVNLPQQAFPAPGKE